MKVKKLENFLKVRGAKDCKWSGLNGPGTQTPHFQKIFQLFHFHTGRPILITPESQLWEKGNFSTPKLDETEGFQCLGHSNWTICSPLSHFCFQNFPPFSLSYWEANSYYPRGPILGKGQFLNSKTE